MGKIIIGFFLLVVMSAQGSPYSRDGVSKINSPSLHYVFSGTPSTPLKLTLDAQDIDNTTTHISTKGLFNIRWKIKQINMVFASFDLPGTVIRARLSHTAFNFQQNRNFNTDNYEIRAAWKAPNFQVDAVIPSMGFHKKITLKGAEINVHAKAIGGNLNINFADKFKSLAIRDAASKNKNILWGPSHLNIALKNVDDKAWRRMIQFRKNYSTQWAIQPQTKRFYALAVLHNTKSHIDGTLRSSTGINKMDLDFEMKLPTTVEKRLLEVLAKKNGPINSEFDNKAYMAKLSTSSLSFDAHVMVQADLLKKVMTPQVARDVKGMMKKINKNTYAFTLSQHGRKVLMNNVEYIATPFNTIN